MIGHGDNRSQGLFGEEIYDRATCKANLRSSKSHKSGTKMKKRKMVAHIYKLDIAYSILSMCLTQSHSYRPLAAI